MNETADGGALVRVEALRRVYGKGARAVTALQDVSLQLFPGQVAALRGRSGSGKTTLLNCIGGLDRPTGGTVWVSGAGQAGPGGQPASGWDVGRLAERERVALRRHVIGFIFQSHALIPTYSAAENVDLVLRLAGMGRRERRRRVREVLQMVGLEKWMAHRPHELSGGQQQRVSLARAVAPRPLLVLADEPTGELDTATGQQMLQLLRRLASQEGMGVLIASHDPAVTAIADRVYVLEDGRLSPA
ncbi:MAG: ABC transporter ATP-binding protein [bacterium]